MSPGPENPVPSPKIPLRNSAQANCSNCRLGPLCLPISLQTSEIEELDEIVQRGRPLQKSDRLYRAGDAFRSVYAVRSGAVKTLCVSSDGIEQVTGFYLPGEIMGMDGLATNYHSNSAIALETSSICEIPFSRLQELSAKLPNLQRRFFQLMSKEITQEQHLITLLSKNSAEQRVANLLLSISARQQNRGLCATDFHLPMSRSDIGNYLGLTIETVSRLFGKLHKNGVIHLDKKHVRIDQLETLRELACSD